MRIVDRMGWRSLEAGTSMDAFKLGLCAGWNWAVPVLSGTMLGLTKNPWWVIPGIIAGLVTVVPDQLEIKVKRRKK